MGSGYSIFPFAKIGFMIQPIILKRISMMSDCCKKWMGRSNSSLFFRLAAGLSFFFHGWSKLMTLGGTTMFFGHLGLVAPFAWLVCLLEVVGGLALIFDIAVPFVSAAFVIDMF